MHSHILKTLIYAKAEVSLSRKPKPSIEISAKGKSRIRESEEVATPAASLPFVFPPPCITESVPASSPFFMPPPDDIKEINKKNFEHAARMSSDSFAGWPVNGFFEEDNYNIFVGNTRIYLELSNLISKVISLLANTEKDPFTLGDFGCGMGGFLARMKEEHSDRIKVAGVAAAYTEEKEGSQKILLAPGVEKKEITIGDLQEVYNLFEGQYFDAIISFTTMIHALDALRVIAHAYKLAKRFIFIDRICFFIDEDYRLILFEYLKRQGHKIAFIYDDDGGLIEGLIIIKTELPLDFPVQYKQGSEERVKYSPTPELIQFKSEYESLVGNSEAHNQLAELLQNGTFQSLQFNKKIIAIKKIVATMSPAQIKQDQAKLRSIQEKEEERKSPNCELFVFYQLVGIRKDINIQHKLAELIKKHGKNGLFVEQITTMAAAELEVDNYCEFYRQNFDFGLWRPRCKDYDNQEIVLRHEEQEKDLEVEAPKRMPGIA